MTTARAQGDGVAPGRPEAGPAAPHGPGRPDASAGDAPAGGELRRNPVSGRLAIVAPGRKARPTDLRQRGAGGEGPPACPFCPGNEALTPPEVDAVRPDGSAPDGPGWRVRVVPNKYPALSGGHEVIVHSPGHDVELEDLGDAALAEVLAVWQRRLDWHLRHGAAAVTLLVNRGAGAGASLAHPHTQLLATPLVPPLLLDELMSFQRFRERYGDCVLCREVERAGERMVLDGDFVAFTPAASRFAGEVWLAPRDHVADVRDTDPAQLAPALRRLLAAVTAASDAAPLNLWVHTAPAGTRGPFHWHLEVAPRTSPLAGIELGCDIAVVSVDPAAAAAAYRAALPRD